MGAEDGALVGVDDDTLGQRKSANFPAHTMLRKKRLRMPAAINKNCAGTDGESQAEQQNLDKHRVLKDKDINMRLAMVTAMKENRFCKSLQDTSLEKLFDAMDHYEFEAGEVILQQGEPGSLFFVTHTGCTQMEIDGKAVSMMKAPSAFGGVALMYGCPRPASVIAAEKTGVWAAPRQDFLRILQEESSAYHEENKGFLDQVPLFDGLSSQQKEGITSTALVIERVSPGQVVAMEGSELISLFVVKSGRLRRVLGGRYTDDGSFIDETTVTELTTGHCFGERAFWTGVLNHSLVADTESELIGIRVEQLREYFGDGDAFQRLFVGSVFQQFPVAVRMAASERAKLIHDMEVSVLHHGDKVQDDVLLLVVLEGNLYFKDGALGRGDWCLGKSLSKLQQAFNMQNCKPCEPHVLTSSDDCCIVTATERTLVGCWENIADWTHGDVSDQITKMTLLKGVPMFQHFSSAQIFELAKKLALTCLHGGDLVFDACDTVSHLYIVLTGQIKISSAATCSSLGPGSYFAEQTLLFNELKPDTATAVGDTELWTLSRASFREIVSETLRQDMILREELRSQSVLLKDFKAVRLIGVGSFGSVRLVEHVVTGTKYALKRVRKEDGKTPAAVKHESDLALHNNHPFLLSTFSVFEAAHSAYILSELISGGNLYDRINTQRRVCTRKEAQFYIGSLVLACENLHQRLVVYRDLKPENVMLMSDGYVKIVDFGISKKLDPTRPRTYTIAGTVYYMAPEQLRGEGYGTEIDIWSLGVMLFDLVCGYLPFGHESEHEHQIITSILDDPLVFPDTYNDMVAKKFMQGLLQKQSSKRLGAHNLEEIKTSKFFTAAGSGFFGKLLSRELEPPWVPGPTDYFLDEYELSAKVSVSDGEEFFREEGDIGDREKLLKTLGTLKKTNGDRGTLGHAAIEDILAKLTGTKPDQETVAKIAWAADRRGTGVVSREDLLFYIGSVA
eukprot:TRINITY_DN11539_c0_g1_i1.p1 TRINITY_DN11539_c0_g1~~TRINITY_DN11539_c0_g1_i1.p1  ORF type:complete len:961 (-),score=181.02 TRINITY_DN11539_c0_g1_i1:285-3167(-)